MMPTTRSASRNVPTHTEPFSTADSTSFGIENDSAAFGNLETEDGVEIAGERESPVQGQIKRVMRSVQKLEEDSKKLRKENRELQQQLDAYRDNAQITPRKRTAMNIETISKIQSLEKRVEEMGKRNSRLNKKIKQLREKELKAEAEDLSGENLQDELAGQDVVTKMRKLLGRFSKQMSITTLAEEEDCPICFERLKPKKSYAVPCEHLICAECLPQVSKGADETINCPQCRQVYPREEVELLQYTETERWDELLKLASEYAMIDYTGSDSSSERAEEDFICDDESRVESSDGDEMHAQEHEEDEEHGAVVEGTEPPRPTPEPVHPHSYAASPTSEKRKRLENLAQLRNKKQRIL